MTNEFSGEIQFRLTAGTANELNTFYAPFDVRDFSEDCATLCETIVPEQLDLSEADAVSYTHLTLPTNIAV